MPGVIKETAVEKSAFKITAKSYDESGNLIAPDTLNWTLTDIQGVKIINSRENVVVAVPGSTENILLSGDDLALDNNEKTDRIVLFEATYTSTEFGAGIPLRDESVFTIIPLTRL